MAEQLNFVIDGEWLTDHIRNKFWNERESYSEIENFVCRVLGCNPSNQDTHDLVCGILEHRIKLVGENSFEVVDCPADEYKPITKRIDALDTELALKHIEEDMYQNPLEYVDTFSASMSMDGAYVNHVETYEDIIDYFGYGNTCFEPRHNYPLTSYSTPTKAGLWILEGGAQLVYDIAGKQGRHAHNFWDKVDAYTADRPGFEGRIQKVNAYQRRVQSTEHVVNRNLDFTEQLLTTADAIESETPLAPDDHISQYGAVSPQGEWFSCAWAEHEELARQIVKTYWRDMDFTNSKEYRLPYDYNYESNETHLSSDIDAIEWTHTHDCLTFIVQEEKWVILRYDNNVGWNLIYPDVWSITHQRPTKAQSDCVWEQLIAHEITEEVIGLDTFI